MSGLRSVSRAPCIFCSRGVKQFVWNVNVNMLFSFPNASNTYVSQFAKCWINELKTTTPGCYAFCTFRFGKGPPLAAKVAKMDASAFAMKDTTDNLVDCREKLFKRRKLAGTLQQDTPTRDLLAPHMVQNFDKLTALAKEGKKVGANGHCVGDMSQNPAKRHRAGPFFPTQQKSSLTATILPESLENHVFTSNELSFAHGWPTLEFAPKEYKECLNYDLSEYTLSHQQRLVGDGMSLNCAQAFALYVFSHSVRKDTLDRYIPRPLSFRVSPCEDQEDDPPVSTWSMEQRALPASATPTPGEAGSPGELNPDPEFDFLLDGNPIPPELDFLLDGMDESQPQESDEIHASRLATLSSVDDVDHLAPGRFLHLVDPVSGSVGSGWDESLNVEDLRLPVAGEDLPDFPQEYDEQLPADRSAGP